MWVARWIGPELLGMTTAYRTIASTNALFELQDKYSAYNPYWTNDLTFGYLTKVGPNGKWSGLRSEARDNITMHLKN